MASATAGYGALHNFTVRVLETDYNQFAMLVKKLAILDSVYFEHILYGGIWWDIPIGDLMRDIY